MKLYALTILFVGSLAACEAPTAPSTSAAPSASDEAAAVAATDEGPSTDPARWPELTETSASGVRYSAPEPLAAADGLVLERRRWAFDESEGWAWHARCERPCRAEVTGAPTVVDFTSLVPTEPGARVTINGGFYDTDLAPMGVVIASGETLQPFTGRGGSGVFVVDDQGARVIHQRDFAPADQALQSIDRIVADGRSTVRRRNPRVAARSAVAVSEDAVELIALAADISIQGDPYAQQLSAPSLAGLPLWAWSDYVLATTGATDALNLDGGISTQMSGVFGEQTFSVQSTEGTPNALTVWARP